VASTAGTTHDRALALTCKRLFDEPSKLLHVGRFELVRVLGQGGMGVVYEALDPRSENPVALKMLRASHAQLSRLKQEFRALAGILHPNLVKLNELSAEGGAPFFTMELVRGQDFVSFVRGGIDDSAAPDRERLRLALVQLCDAIHAIHMAGKLHCDLKPSNVLVTPQGRVVVLDFGLARESRPDARSTALNHGGTPGYAAPEQLRGEPTESSDWYALGCMLGEALHGVPRARPGTIGSVTSLERLAERLVCRDPRERPTFDEVRASLGLDRMTGPGLHGPARRAFLGREIELGLLQRALEENSTRSRCVSLRGSAGIGKTALLRQFATLFASRVALTLASRCYERETLSFNALEDAIEQVSRRPETSRMFAVALSESERDALCHAFPTFAETFSHRGHGGRSREPDLVVARELAFQALAKLLSAIADGGTLLLTIDDAQWTDADSGMLLSTLLSAEQGPSILVVAAARPEDLTNPLFEAMRSLAWRKPCLVHFDEMTLGPLDEQASVALADSLLERPSRAEPSPEASRIAREARGNPLFIAEIAAWMAHARTTAVYGQLGSFDAMVRERAARHSAPAVALLELLAVAGRPLAASLALEAIGRQARASFATIDELLRSNLVALTKRGGNELLDVAHGRIGEVLRRSMSVQRKQDLHARLARALDGDDAASAVIQYLEAGLGRQAAQCAEQAGHLAMAGLAFALAASMFERALQAGDWTRAARARLCAELALAREHAGQGLLAGEAYAEAAQLSDDAVTAAHWLGRAAQHFMHHGRHAQGLALLRDGHALLGLSWPRSRAALVLYVARQLIAASAQADARSAHHGGCARLGGPALTRARVRFLSEVGTCLELEQPIRSLYGALIILRELENEHDELWHVRGRALRGLLRCVRVLPGGPRRGLDELRSACDSADRLGDLATAGVVYGQLAGGHFLHGHPHEALAACLRSEACQRRMPLSGPDFCRTTGLILVILYELGEIRQLTQRMNAFTSEARHRHNALTSFWLHGNPLCVISWFAAHDRARSDAELQGIRVSSQQHPECGGLRWSDTLCRAEHELYWGDPNIALAHVEAGWNVLARHDYPLSRTIATLLRARCAIGAAATLEPGAQRAVLLLQVRRDVMMLGLSRRPSVQVSLALLLAGCAALQGRDVAALTWTERARSKSRAAGLKNLHAVATLCRATLLATRQEEEARAARQSLRAEGVQDPVRWTAWQAPGFKPRIGVLDAG
jgi:serine/threonine protein kinase